MAKARMLHKSISISSQVNRLSLPARLLFTWMIPHADDEGKLKGNPDYIRATVVPMANWSKKRIQLYLFAIRDTGLIYYWEQNSEWFVELVKWKQYQQIRTDRFTHSILPSFLGNSDNQQTTNSQPDDNQLTPQSNISESNEIEVNKSEVNVEQTIANKYSSKDPALLINPRRFEPSSEGEAAALEVWKQLEPYNPFAFKSTYLKAFKKGLPADIFYQFSSEIKQDPTIKNRGAVFNSKFEEWSKDNEPN